jgi:anti-sigma regulatory factor (Ser/Thr protein kinase)
MIAVEGRRPEMRHFNRSVLATPASVGLLRDLTEVFLRKWGLEYKIDDVAVVVSELATNAVAAAPGTVIALDVHILLERPYLLVELWDGSPRRPIPATSGPDDESGRGLTIVGCLATEWGVRIPSHGGKTVWAAIALRPSG